MQVTVSRRGLRNQLKTFLFRSKSNASSETPRAGAAASGGSAQYGAGTTEGQMRQLADLAFVMQDYETAQSTLKLLASDYKTDKAWKHLAGVQVTHRSCTTAGKAPFLNLKPCSLGCGARCWSSDIST